MKTLPWKVSCVLGVVLVLGAALPGAARAAELAVPGDYATLAAALAAAGDDDTIVIATGNYAGSGFCDLGVTGLSNVTIRSATGVAADVVIDCGHAARLLEVTDATVTLRGVTVRAAGSEAQQEALLLTGDALTLIDCVVETSLYRGIVATSGALVLDNTRIDGTVLGVADFDERFAAGVSLLWPGGEPGPDAALPTLMMTGGEIRNCVGAGVRFTVGASITASATTFSENLYGAWCDCTLTEAGALADETFTFTDCAFTDNTVAGIGVFRAPDVSWTLTVIGGTFSGNEAGVAVAPLFDAADPARPLSVVRNATITGNTIFSTAHTFDGCTITGTSVGGVTCVYLVDSTVSDNAAGQLQPAVIAGLGVIDSIVENNCCGGGVDLGAPTMIAAGPVMRGSQITGNQSDFPDTGGGVTVGMAGGLIERSVISNNTAGPFGGGGIFLLEPEIEIRTTRISGNTAGVGGIAFGESGLTEVHGSLIVGNVGTDTVGGVEVADVYSSTIVGNRGADTGGLGEAGVVQNSIVADNRGLLREDFALVLTPMYSLLEGSTGRGYPAHVIDAVPGFVDPGSWDDNGTPADVLDDVFTPGDYQLAAGSPAIDTGDPATVVAPAAEDLAWNLRLWDADDDDVLVIDMGAFEHGSYPIGDTNCDGDVDTFDVDSFVFAISAAAADPEIYNDAYPDCDLRTGDLNRDGDVDTFDVDAFVDAVSQVGG